MHPFCSTTYPTSSYKAQRLLLCCPRNWTRDCSMAHFGWWCGKSTTGIWMCSRWPIATAVWVARIACAWLATASMLPLIGVSGLGLEWLVLIHLTLVVVYNLYHPFLLFLQVSPTQLPSAYRLISMVIAPYTAQLHVNSVMYTLGGVRAVQTSTRWPMAPAKWPSLTWFFLQWLPSSMFFDTANFKEFISCSMISNSMLITKQTLQASLKILLILWPSCKEASGLW